MNKDNQLITDIDNKLNKRQWSFLQYIAQGLKVTEAYKLAGFKGKNIDSAYLLNHRLKDKINEILVNNGFNRNNFMVEVSKLIDLPLRDDQKQVSIDQKIKILRLFKDSLPEQKKESSFTQFVISNGTIEAKHQDTSIIVDTKLDTNSNESNPNSV
jgi:GMP synthase PP-ATPase subunit